MSQYLEFSTPRKKRRGLSLNNPVHDGKLPTRFMPLRGVWVDGRLMEFSDETVPERMHRALVDGKALRPRSSFKCVAFVALMEGITLGRLGPTDDSDFLISRKLTQVGSSEYTESPVEIARELADLSIDYVHMISPAHTAKGAQYVHKLGSGPLCLSGLNAALMMYNATIAHPVTYLDIRRG